MVLIRSFIIWCSLVVIIDCTLSPTKTKKAQKSSSSVRKGPSDKSVIDLNLVTENTTAKDILHNYQAYWSEKSGSSIEGISLAYVTPVSN